MDKNTFEAIPSSQRANQVLEGTAYWACLHTPNTAAQKKFGADPFFGLSLGLDDEGVKKAKAMGLNVKDATESTPMAHVDLKRKVRTDKTAEEVRPDVVDDLGQDIPRSILIGNGSKVMVKSATYWYDNNGGGVGAALLKVRIVDLIPYVSKDQDMETDGGGFSVSDYMAKTGTVAEDDVPFDVTESKATGTNPALFDE